MSISTAQKQTWSKATKLKTHYIHMWSDFGKPTMLSHLAFREIRILNIEWAVVFQWCSVAMPNLLHE